MYIGVQQKWLLCYIYKVSGSRYIIIRVHVCVCMRGVSVCELILKRYRPSLEKKKVSFDRFHS